MSNCEMFGMAFLSHGEDDGVVMTYDSPMHVTEFVDPIKQNLTLIGKPKVKKVKFMTITITSIL